MSMARETVWSWLGMGDSLGAALTTLPWELKPELLVLSSRAVLGLPRRAILGEARLTGSHLSGSSTIS